MNNQLLAELIQIRHETKMALGGLNGDYDSEFTKYHGNPEPYRAGWARESLDNSLLRLNNILEQHDAEIYEFEAKLTANSDYGSSTDATI